MWRRRLRRPWLLWLCIAFVFGVLAMVQIRVVGVRSEWARTSIIMDGYSLYIVAYTFERAMPKHPYFDGSWIYVERPACLPEWLFEPKFRFLSSGGVLHVYVPVWAPLLPVLAVGVLAQFPLRRRAKSGCSKCGYDLTGNVSGRCPECGEPAPDSRRRMVS